jgi:4-amino-4-deoxy-L-arabinose transferase-like glycosyltransferase
MSRFERMRMSALLALAALVYGANFWGTSIYILDEAKNAGCAMEMWQTAEYVVPTFNGELRTDKPPLHYYFMMAAYQAFGVSPFSARLFSVLAGIALVAVLYFFIRKIVNESTAWWTGLVMVASVQMAIQFHLAVPDPYLLFFLFTGLLSFYYGTTQSKTVFIYVFYACAALAFLSKGLIAIAFPGLIICTYWLLTGGITLTRLRAARLLSGGLLFLLIAAPWYVWVGVETDGAWLHGFFVQHNVERYTQTMEGHRGFLGAPFVILVAATLPLSVFVVPAVRAAWRQRQQQPFFLFCLVAVVTIAGFFSFSKTILPSYPAPAVPFLAVLFGAWAAQQTSAKPVARSEWLALGFHVLIALAIPVAAWVALGMEASLAELQPLALAFAVLPVFALLAMIIWRSHRSRALYALLAGWMCVSVVFFAWANPELDNRNPIHVSEKYLPADTPVYYYESMNPAFVFAWQRTIPRASREEIQQRVAAGESFVVLTRQQFQPDLADMLRTEYCQKELFENPVSCVMVPAR